MPPTTRKPLDPMNDRFDPHPDVAYATCKTCQLDFQTEAEASAHGRATLKPTGNTTGITAQGHGWHVNNPPRHQRIQRAVETILTEAVEEDIVFDIRTREIEITEDAVEIAVGNLQKLVDKGDLTYTEVTTALKYQPEFLASWRDSLPEGLDVSDNQPELFPNTP